MSMLLRSGRCSRIWRTPQVPHKYPTSTPQADASDPAIRTSTGQVQDKLRIDNVYISCLVNAIGNQELSLKNMMEALGLKGRDNYLTLYLNPAIAAGYVRLLYPDSPRHPRQKYLLTVKGLAVYMSQKQ